MSVTLLKNGIDPYKLTLYQMFEFFKEIQEQQNEDHIRAMQVARSAMLDTNGFKSVMRAFEKKEEPTVETIDFSEMTDD